MFWDEWIEKTFYRHICENENFMYLNGKNVLCLKTAQIVMDYLNKNPINTIILRRCLQKNMKTGQFVYSRCFPEIYFLNDKRGIDLKSEFLLSFKAWKNKKKFVPTAVAVEKQNSVCEEEINDEKSKLEDEKASKKNRTKKA